MEAYVEPDTRVLDTVTTAGAATSYLYDAAGQRGLRSC